VSSWLTTSSTLPISSNIINGDRIVGYRDNEVCEGAMIGGCHELHAAEDWDCNRHSAEYRSVGKDDELKGLAAGITDWSVEQRPGRI
jgi:hypothetical protein